MAIEFSCACGKVLRAADGSGGKRARCPKCGAIVSVPMPAVVPDDEGEYALREPDPVATPPAGARVEVPAAPAATAPAVARGGRALSFLPQMPVQGRSLRRFAYLLLVLAFIPLLVSMFQPADEVWDRVERTIAAHPEQPDLGARIERLAKANGEEEEEEVYVDLEKVLAEMPGHRLEGALLARDSWAHWGMALAAAGGYFAFLLLAFPRAKRYTKGLLFAGLFTATAGIIFLLAVQWIAFNMPVTFRGGGRIGLILLIIKLIGYSYVMADMGYGFFLSFVGFTCGVGLCEEVTKVIPLLFRIKSVPGEEDATWNTMLLWGLASGIGFGIAEGIMYSSRHYNGIDGMSIYLVRFLSCVVLHAVWAGAAGISIYRRQDWLHNAENGWSYSGWVVMLVAVPMVLHGLYDTLLKQDHGVWAVVVAVASFGWLAWQIETSYRKEPDAVLPAAA